MDASLLSGDAARGGMGGVPQALSFDAPVPPKPEKDDAEHPVRESGRYGDRVGGGGCFASSPGKYRRSLGDVLVVRLALLAQDPGEHAGMGALFSTQENPSIQENP